MGSEIFFSFVSNQKICCYSQDVATMVTIFTCTHVIVLCRSRGNKNHEILTIDFKWCPLSSFFILCSFIFAKEVIHLWGFYAVNQYYSILNAILSVHNYIFDIN